MRMDDVNSEDVNSEEIDVKSIDACRGVHNSHELKVEHQVGFGW